MSTILARRLKASRAKPVLVREDSSSELDTVDLRLATLNKDIASDTWNSMDSGYDSCSTSSSSSSSDSSPNSSSIFFEEMDDLSLPDASVRSSISSSFQDEHEAASIIQCLACDESDNAIEESWQEHGEPPPLKIFRVFSLHLFTLATKYPAFSDRMPAIILQTVSPLFAS
ncbi:hypothetical protein P389DRAFT_188831 [Cystobasidium minutum MCA 4210]|uniref:uncharacterized protein n=1 Tax=Cystobasidium minutum MCA 4210 TaxID=1397322 RepID=UPI0034CDB984|eukprot:jgi/Rhomi1/188831/estExt_fgenesh1_pg.C_3_t10244